MIISLFQYVFYFGGTDCPFSQLLPPSLHHLLIVHYLQVVPLASSLLVGLFAVKFLQCSPKVIAAIA